MLESFYQKKKYVRNKFLWVHGCHILKETSLYATAVEKLIESSAMTVTE